MLLVRHYLPRPPYDDYGTLSLEQLDRLATFADDPEIQRFSREKVPDILMQELRGGRTIHCSESKRTKATYVFACEALAQQVQEPVIDNRLKEIWFKPSGFVGLNEQPLEAIRKKLFVNLFEGSEYIEPLAELIVRINNLLDDPSMRDSICFTHGFLMRLIKAYVEVNRDLELLPQALEKTPPIEYLGCLKIPS